MKFQTWSSFFSSLGKTKFSLISLFSFFLVLNLATVGYGQGENSVHSTLKISPNIIGETTHFIGACEGNINFDISDLTTLGINTYRIYGGMSRWETEDDDNRYGWPSINEIKQNPDIISWEKWDNVMTYPETGSDYGFSGDPDILWQGSARDIFEQLQQAHIRPVLTIRNTDPEWNPEWALQLNPPRTEEDWNEWWEHVFATVYWLNVRNDYRVDDFEIHNEPDNRQQGWGGSQNDYIKFSEVTEDAISYVYETFLENRKFALHSPKTTGGSSWPKAILQNHPDNFNIINIHNYGLDVLPYIRQVRTWMHGTIHDSSPIWLGEWGTYTEGYSDLKFSLNLVQNLISMSMPGDGHIDGSHLFSLYDWGSVFEGLIDSNGTNRLSYYAFKMGIEALQGGKPILKTFVKGANALNPNTIATINENGNINILVVNKEEINQLIDVDVAAFDVSTGIVKAFNNESFDQVVTSINVENGKVHLNLPPNTAYLVVLGENQ